MEENSKRIDKHIELVKVHLNEDRKEDDMEDDSDSEELIEENNEEG